MSLASIILIPLLAGYAFSVSWAGSRYHITREQGYHLYFRTAIYGVLLSIIASLIHLYIVTQHPALLVGLKQLLAAFMVKKTTLQESSLVLFHISAITLILGLSLGHLLNLLPFSRRLLLHIATRNDDFERLILRALRKLVPICVTMSNEKVYVGYVISTIDPAVERTALRILPLLSGYLDKDNKKIHFNTSYHEIYEQINDDNDNQESKHLSHLEVSDFEKVLPFDEIQSSHLFDIIAYQYFTLHELTTFKEPMHGAILDDAAIAEVERAIENATAAASHHSDSSNKPLKELR